MTTGPPVFATACRLSPEKLTTAKKEFTELEHLGIVWKSNSPWSSPLHIVNKPGGGFGCAVITADLTSSPRMITTPIKHVTDFNTNLAGKRVFSKIGLIKGYYQVPVAPQDVQKTAVITPFGLFKFPQTLFGLKNAAQDFQ